MSLKAILRAAGITQDELSNKTGKSPASISRYITSFDNGDYSKIDSVFLSLFQTLVSAEDPRSVRRAIDDFVSEHYESGVYDLEDPGSGTVPTSPHLPQHLRSYVNMSALRPGSISTDGPVPNKSRQIGRAKMDQVDRAISARSELDRVFVRSIIAENPGCCHFSEEDRSLIVPFTSLTSAPNRLTPFRETLAKLKLIRAVFLDSSISASPLDSLNALPESVSDAIEDLEDLLGSTASDCPQDVLSSAILEVNRRRNSITYPSWYLVATVTNVFENSSVDLVIDFHSIKAPNSDTALVVAEDSIDFGRVVSVKSLGRFPNYMEAQDMCSYAKIQLRIASRDPSLEGSIERANAWLDGLRENISTATGGGN